MNLIFQNNYHRATNRIAAKITVESRLLYFAKQNFKISKLKLSRQIEEFRGSESSAPFRGIDSTVRKATFLQIVENGYRCGYSAANSIKQVTSRDNGITYCRPKDTIGGSVTGKLFSMLVESANFAVTVEIRGVDTRVVAMVVVWPASWNQLTKLLSDIYIS